MGNGHNNKNPEVLLHYSTCLRLGGIFYGNKTLARPRWIDSEQRWVYRIMIDGARRAFVSSMPGTKGKNECLDKAEAALNKVDINIRLKDAWPLHLEDVKKRLGEDSEAYRSAKVQGESHIVINPIRHKKVRDISDQDWQNLLNNAKRKKAYLGRTNLSKKTLKNIRSEIMLFCKFAKKSKWIKALPDTLDIPKSDTVGKEILQPEQFVAFMVDTDSKYRFLPVWQLMAAKGYRPGEVLGLQEADIEGDVIYIRRSVNDRGYITDGKNENAVRWSILTDIDKIILDRQKTYKRKLKLISRWVFPNLVGNHLQQKDVRESWDAYRLEHGLPSRCTPYGLRHTFVTYQKDVVSYKQLQIAMGHAESMDTIGIYGKHEIDGERQKAADKMNKEYANLAKKMQDGVI